MRKTLSVFLAVLMLITIVMPISVYAKNGPYKSNNADDSTMALISFVDVYGDISFLYPASLDTQLRFKNSKNISYDEKTNTLTLSNFKTDEIMVVTAMGDDFKIKLSGYNELGCIISSDLSWGSSITITGKGVLYVNEKKNYADAVYVDGSGTGKAFFKVEKTVGVKLFKGTDNAIGIYGVAEADSKKTLILEGTVSAGQTTSHKYIRNIYEQEKVKTIEHYEGPGIFCGKSGDGNENKIFIAEVSNGNKNTYNVAEVVFDNELKNYIVLPVNKTSKNITLKENGYVTLAEGKYPEDVFVIDDYVVNMDVCIDENNKRCVFIDYSTSDKLESDIEVYEVLEHTKYGKLALLYNPKKTYKELKKVKSVTEYNHLNTSSSVTINAVPKTVPKKVVLKSAANSYGGVKISWNATNDTVHYRVYRAQLVNNKWSGWNLLSKTKETNYFDNTVGSGVTYKYTVRAENILGLGAFDSNGVKTTYLSLPTTTISNTTNGVKVLWTKSNGATGYTVYRSILTNGKWSGWKVMGTTKADKLAWIDKSVNAGTTYKYTVRAINNDIKSSFKETEGLLYLSVPAVKISNSAKGVNVSWTKITGAINYAVYRAEFTNGKWSSWKVVSRTGSVTNYVDSTVNSGVTYRYTVRAINGKTMSAYKQSDSLLYLAQPTTTVANATNGIKVSWTKSNGATGYTVYRSVLTNGKWSGWKVMGTAKADKFAWLDKSVDAGATYRYTVRAIKSNVKSTFTATNGLVRLIAPTVKVKNSNNGVKVSWNKISGAKGYYIYRAEYVNGKWSGWKNMGKLGNVNSYIDTTATKGVTYKYTIRAYNDVSFSAYVASATVKR